MPTLACVCALLLAQSAGGENRGASFAAPDDFAELEQPAAAFDADARPGLVGSAPSSSSLSPFCASTMRRLQSSAPATAWPPPCPLPPGALRRAFEAGGAMPITRDFCLAERHEGGEPVVWTEAFLNAYGARVAAGAEGGSYTVAHVAQVRAAVRAAAAALGGVRHALVIGTDRPWIEVLLLAEGAARVTTFEYGDIISHHPRVAAKPYRALAADVLAGDWQPADLVVTYSSVEHSGLGRYGDALDPDGDVHALRQAWCMTRPGGLALVGLPMACAATGALEFNAHRIYGMARLAEITQGWEWVGFDGPGCEPYLPSREPQPIAILRKPASGERAQGSNFDAMMRDATRARSGEGRQEL